MTRLALVLVPLIASLAFAQAKAAEERKAAPINEIERGFYFEARGGFWSTINPPANAGTPSYFSPGLAAQADMGFDLGERLSPSIFLLASTNSMKSDYVGLSRSGTAQGDFSALIPGAQVKVRLVGFDDGQDVQRTWIYVRAGAGAVFYSPQSLLPVFDLMISGGPGLEYFTRLRHFSIGIEANFNFMLLTQSFGFSVLPTVKYAF